MKIGGKEYEYQKATLASMRQCAKLEREIAAIDSDKMIEDDKVFEELIAKWSLLLGVILKGGETINPESVDAAELGEAKRGFFNQVTPTK